MGHIFFIHSLTVMAYQGASFACMSAHKYTGVYIFMCAHIDE